MNKSLALTAFAFFSLAGAQSGWAGDVLTFGQSAALEGPASGLGQGMRQGILAAFEQANRSGGVNGYTLALKSLDDGYEPGPAVANTEALIAEDVLALVGAVGTPTSVKAQPVATAAGVPFIGAFTGAEFLRAPELRSVINVRGSYYAEAETWIERLTTDLAIKDIAILYQNDAFGQAGLDGVEIALDKRGMSLAAGATFERNTVDVEDALESIRAANPQAVVMVGPYKPVAEFVRQSRASGFDPVFIAISFVGADALAAELGSNGEGVVVTQVVPFPWFADIPLVGAYQADLKALDPAAEPGFVSLEGYMVGQTVIEAVRRVWGEPTREALIDAIYEESIDIGGVSLTFGEGDNQGMDKIYLTVIGPDGAYQSIRNLSGLR